MTEEKLGNHPSERTIILVELAIIVSPDSQIGCCAVLVSRVRFDARTDSRTSELGRQEAIPPRETDRVGKNCSRNCVSGTQPGPRHWLLGFFSLQADLEVLEQTRNGTEELRRTCSSR